MTGGFEEIRQTGSQDRLVFDKEDVHNCTSNKNVPPV
jgi:hypothetical protein